VESLMPLRLARYGVPLAQTAPSGLAAAGIEPALLPPAPRPQQSFPQAAPGRRKREVAEWGRARPRPLHAAADTSERPRGQREPDRAAAERFAAPYQDFIEQFRVEPTAVQWAFWLRDQYGISTGAGGLLPERQVQPLLHILHHRYGLPAAHNSDDEQPQPPDQSRRDYLHSARRSSADERGSFPDAAEPAPYTYKLDALTGANRTPHAGEDPVGSVTALQKRQTPQTEPPAATDAAPIKRKTDGPAPETNVPKPTTAGTATRAAKNQRSRWANAPVDEPPPAAHTDGLTTPDRYYLAWMEYQEQNNSEPTDKELSAHCANKGLRGRGNKPVSPANLRRHFLRWRVYNIWAQHRTHTHTPTPTDIAHACAQAGITGQHHKPITPHYITQEAADFERRWHTLNRHHTKQPH
ncbi:hypothetical protein ACGFZU_43090, partial [Streptomyces tendae]